MKSRFVNPTPHSSADFKTLLAFIMGLPEVKQPWRIWFKNLLAHVIKNHAPTVDAKWVVAYLEHLLGGTIAKEPCSRPDQIARLLGHINAVCDHPIAANASKPARLQYENDLIALMPLIKPEIEPQMRRMIDDTDFHKRAANQLAYADAYAKTFTSNGKLRGETQASLRYNQLLTWAARCVCLPPRARTLSELLRLTWPLNPNPSDKPLTQLEKLQFQDWQVEEIQRLKTTLKRLEYKFGVRTIKPRKIKPLRT